MSISERAKALVNASNGIQMDRAREHEGGFFGYMDHIKRLRESGLIYDTEDADGYVRVFMYYRDELGDWLDEKGWTWTRFGPELVTEAHSKADLMLLKLTWGGA